MASAQRPTSPPTSQDPCAPQAPAPSSPQAPHARACARCPASPPRLRLAPHKPPRLRLLVGHVTPAVVEHVMGLQRPQLLPAGGLAVAPQARHVVRDEEVHGRVQPDAAARSSCPPLPARDHGGDGGDVCGDSRGRGTSPSSSIPGCPPRRVGGGQEQAGPPPLLHPPPPSGCTCARRLGALLRPQAAPHDRQTPTAAPLCSAFSPPGPGCALSPVTAFLSESHPELPEGLLLLLSLRPPQAGPAGHDSALGQGPPGQ